MCHVAYVEDSFRPDPHPPYRVTDIVVIVFNVTDRNSFQNCKGELLGLSNYLRSDVMVFAAGDDCDKVEERVVTNEEAAKFFSQYWSPETPYYDVSSRTGEGVDELFHDVMMKCLAQSDVAKRNDNASSDPVSPSPPSKSHCIVC